jgi:glucosamine-6-phosphate deaminase
VIDVRVLPDREAVGVEAADLIDAAVIDRSERVLGLATGSSPGPAYSELIRRHGQDPASPYRSSHAFLLDEYVGLPPDHPERYARVIRREFTEAMGIDAGMVHGPDPDAPDLEQACRAYDAAITASGGVGVQILGIGTDGHIAFNAPGTPFSEGTHVARLSSSTRRDNARFFDGDPERVPASAVSQGIATILRARALVVVAMGEAKAEIVARLLSSDPTEELPASALHLHSDVTLVLDRSAARRVS